MIEIIVKAPSGTGKSTIASYIAKLLYNEGLDFIVDDLDEIHPKFATKERIQSIINKGTIVSISHEQKPRESV